MSGPAPAFGVAAAPGGAAASELRWETTSILLLVMSSQVAQIFFLPSLKYL